jgi:hypothetical protein
VQCGLRHGAPGCQCSESVSSCVGGDVAAGPAHTSCPSEICESMLLNVGNLRSWAALVSGATQEEDDDYDDIEVYDPHWIGGWVDPRAGLD